MTASAPVRRPRGEGRGAGSPPPYKSANDLTVKLLGAVRWLSKDTIYAVCGVLNLRY